MFNVLLAEKIENFNTDDVSLFANVDDNTVFHFNGLCHFTFIDTEIVPQFVILNNLRTLGISREEYLSKISKL
jgi:hypothetical protein